MCFTPPADPRLKNRYHCPVCNEVVERDQLVRGYEVAKGEYVRFKLGHCVKILPLEQPF